jgi:hypothetical protein
MPAPELLLIKRMEDLHTGLIGRCEAGQFFITDSLPVAVDSDFKLTEKDRPYVVRYLFKLDGEFSNAEHAKIECLSQRECLHLADEKKRKFLGDLGPYSFCDIVVKPFEMTLNGIKFGLVYCEETDSINLEPGPVITFMEPWDGEYYT